MLCIVLTLLQLASAIAIGFILYYAVAMYEIRCSGYTVDEVVELMTGNNSINKLMYGVKVVEEIRKICGEWTGFVMDVLTYGPALITIVLIAAVFLG